MWPSHAAQFLVAWTKLGAAGEQGQGSGSGSSAWRQDLEGTRVSLPGCFC
jgi:hypothetical protein